MTQSQCHNFLFFNLINVLVFFKILMYWLSADFSGGFRLKGKSRKRFGIISTKPVFFLISVLGVWEGTAARQHPPPPGCAPERKYWIDNVSRASEEDGQFRIQFGRLKNEGQNFFKYFRMSI
jgi:hypothetical protein